MAAVTKDDVVKFIEQMSVLDLSELVKELEDKFGVSAASFAAPVMAPQAGGAEAEAEAQTEFTVNLAGIGDKKIQVIKVVRAITGLGLKEAKELVDNAPKPVKENVPEEEAKDIKAKLEEAGATAEIK